jgi:hypothetical protein
MSAGFLSQNMNRLLMVFMLSVYRDVLRDLEVLCVLLLGLRRRGHSYVRLTGSGRVGS